jgi:hypothetical protein
MSILIKGMEMPKEGEYIKIHANGLAVKIIYDESKMKSVPKNGLGYYAKAVPVPEHGDLVDRREAIIDANERAYDFWLSDDEVNATIQFLKEQPTIIPAEEGK